MLIYGDFDISDFWLVTDYALENYVGEPLTGALATSIESELGYKLPLSYIELMKVQNGGLLARTSYRVRQRCIEIESIYGINRSKRATLGGIWTQRKAFVARNPRTGEAIIIGRRTSSKMCGFAEPDEREVASHCCYLCGIPDDGNRHHTRGLVIRTSGQSQKSLHQSSSG
jgi:SMI1 / KNR4 family (SUKH-1)